ncbi:DUF5329 family protein [Leptospira sp. WS39.C2]
MRHYFFQSTLSSILLLIVLFAFTPIFSQTKPCVSLSEEEKIQTLLKKIGTFNGSFIRNGEAHTAKDAENHLRYKLKEAKNSFFAPDPKDWTAKLFIDKVATKSFISGTLYMIRYPDGKEKPSASWLNEELKKIEKCL